MMSFLIFSAKVNLHPLSLFLSFEFRPALFSQGWALLFSKRFIIFKKRKSKSEVVFVVVVVVLYDVRSIIYIYIPLSFMFI